MRFKDFYKDNFILLDEATINDLRSDTDTARIKRSRPIATHYQSISKGGIISFDSTAITTTNIDFWQQIIKPTVKLTKNMSLKDFRSAFNSDIKVNCNCPDFLYKGFKYMGSEEDYLYGRKEKRFPIIKNPDLEGSVCKHLHNALGVMKANLPKIYSDFKKQFK